MRFTQGPWSYSPSRNCIEGNEIDPDTDLPVMILDCVGSMGAGGGCHTSEGNLSLMAAAPELFYAAHAVLRNAGYLCGEAEPTINELRVHRKYLHDLREAMIKADPNSFSMTLPQIEKHEAHSFEVVRENDSPDDKPSYCVKHCHQQRFGGEHITQIVAENLTLKEAETLANDLRAIEEAQKTADHLKSLVDSINVNNT
jgi:hypothetical protein